MSAPYISSNELYHLVGRSHLPDNHPKNYYFEREWRRLGYLLFQPSDIVRVLVAGDYVERLKQDRPMYSGVVTPAPK